MIETLDYRKASNDGPSMTLPAIYSRRKRQTQPSDGDVYQYVEFSQKLRNQTVFLLGDALSLLYISTRTELWHAVLSLMREELGVPRLVRAASAEHELTLWFGTHPNTDEALDYVELMFQGVSKAVAKAGEDRDRLTRIVERLNARFLEGAFGYQLEDFRIIQISSQFMHQNVVLPTLSLLRNSRFSAANEEYRKAHDEYRAGEYADCITDCGKALESVLKVLAAEGNWPGVSNTSPLKPLLDAAFSNGAFPSYLEDQVTGLRKLIQGAGTVRNKSGAHGAGTAEEAAADKRLATYQLHQTAAALLFIANQQTSEVST